MQKKLSSSFFFALPKLILGFALGFFLLVSQSLAFNDLSSADPYYVSVLFLKDQGVVSGYEGDQFKAPNPVNRAEISKMIVELFEIPTNVSYKEQFPDVREEDWFSPYVLKLADMGVVKGDDTDGKFQGARQVNTSEAVKMMLMANGIEAGNFKSEKSFPTLPADAWFTPWVQYAVETGILNIPVDQVDPAKPLTRGEVAEALYRLYLSLKGDDTQLLLSQAEEHLTQIEPGIALNKVSLANDNAIFAVTLTQKALSNMPDNDTVLVAAKIARAYQLLVESFILGIERKNQEAIDKANAAIDKAQEGWAIANAEGNEGGKLILAHVADRGREILVQLGAEEQ